MNAPEPYWTDGQVTLYHGDCREVLPELAPGSVDLVMTGPVTVTRLADPQAWQDALRPVHPGGSRR